MPVDTPFLHSSNEVVRAFLSSVVLVDDQAYLTPTVEYPHPTHLVSPGKQGATHPDDAAAQVEVAAHPIGEIPVKVLAEGDSVTLEAPAGEEAVTKLPSTRDHSLDGKTVIDGFARIGVVCAVLKPSEDELAELSDLIMNLGSNADVIILDWVLYGTQSGEKTLELIHRLVSSAADSGRTRLILVYTAEPNLVEIERGIRKQLKLEEDTPTDTFTIVSGGTRICVYGKAGSHSTRIGDVRTKAPAELADVVVFEFAQMTKGLLSNVAMKSITAIRAKTFQLLSRFNSEVDAPYITQSALISPERAEEQVAALIVSEIQEILEDENVGSLADYPHVIEWLDDQMDNGLTLPNSANLSSADYRAGLAQLLKEGVGNSAITKLKADHPGFFTKIIPGKKEEAVSYVRDTLTAILRSNPPKAHEADEIFTMLMSLRHRYTNPAPQLTLGSVVARTDQTGRTYLLCLQPLCDSVRLKKQRSFALLTLKAAATSKKCELIVRDGTELKFLTLKLNPFMLEMVPFSPNRHEKVMADSQNDGFVFVSTANVLFNWIADLKPAHAQRIANGFASTFSRVGLVESEWNRLGSSL